jgi:hypothetical protein
MRRLFRRRWLVAGLGLALVGATGCQTWIPSVGLTLPSGDYLKHPPQYIPEGPAFPLERELASMEPGQPPPAGGGQGAPEIAP